MINVSGEMADMFKDNESEHGRAMLSSDTGPDSYQIAIGVVFLFLMGFGLVFNAAVIHTFRLTRSLQNPTNILIIGVVTSDTVMVVIGIPSVIASSFNGSWMFGSEWCKGYGFVTTVLGVTDICLMTAVALDRYFVVTRSPVTVKITKFTAVMAIWACLAYGLLWATLPLVGWGRYTLEHSLISCGPDWANDSVSSLSYSVAIFVLVLLVPVCIITYCYVRIVMKIRRQKTAALDRMSSVRQIETTVTFSVFLTILTFVAAWLPYAVMSFWTMVNDINKLNRTVAILAPMLAKSCCVWNPLVYVGRNKYFREALVAVAFSSTTGNINLGSVDRSRDPVAISTVSLRGVYSMTQVTQ